MEEVQLACGHKTGCAERRCITSKGVAHLCGMSKLTHLDLSRHETLTDNSIKLIAECLSRLSHLDIRAHGLSQPTQQALMRTDEGIAALSKLRHLRSLLISNAQVSLLVTPPLPSMWPHRTYRQGWRCLRSIAAHALHILPQVCLCLQGGCHPRDAPETSATVQGCMAKGAVTA